VGGDWQHEHLLTRLTERWAITLIDRPGTYHYANLGYALLGAIIERIDARPFADAMQADLNSLGFHHATFWSPTLPERAAAHGHTKDAVHTPHWYASRYALPFTGLWITTPNLARFGQLLLTDPSLAPMTEGTAHALGPIHATRH